MTIQQAFEIALQHHQSGRLAEAEAIYSRILAVDPRHPDALHLSGVIANYVGRHDVAVDFIRKAVALKPNYPEAHCHLGMALYIKGLADEAIIAFRQAITLKPDLPEAHCNLGNALRDKGQLDEAIDACRRAIALKFHFPEAHNNFGNALKEKGHLDAAIDAYRQAIALRPNFPEAFNNLGFALNDKGQLDEAIAACRQAIALRACSPEAHNNLGNALKDQSQLDEAIAAYRQAVVLKPNYPEAHSNLVYALHFHPGIQARTIAEEHRRWDRKFVEPLQKCQTWHTHGRDPKRRLRIGYVSSNFTRHVTCHFLAPLLGAHDHTEFEIYCYASVKLPDEMTERLKKTADVWRDVLGVSDAALAELVREDKVDILVDLTLHMANNRLLVFARKPAPVQVTWLGYPGSSGLSTMDYRFTDARIDPEGTPWCDTPDMPFRLPDTAWCFDPIDEYPLVSRLPAVSKGHVTFSSFNNFSKVNDPVLQLWTDLMEKVEGSKLLIQCPGGSTQERVRQWFGARGIAPHRIELFSKTATRAEFLQLFERIDIALEPFPYNGGTTTCEALWMGIPVPTFAGTSAVSRNGLSILSAAGLYELVAASKEEYLDLVMNLAGDLPRLAEMRSTLRHRMKTSAFMDAPRFARNVEAAYREMWRKWCAENNPQLT